jgi:cytoskeletal protein RodZ
MKGRFRAPSPALVISLLALFVALGGTSYAAITLPKNSVGAKQLKKNAVTGAKIKNGAVTASKINTKGLTVPDAFRATSADSATNATNATHATTADSATSAANATNATHATSADSATDATNAANAQPVAFAHISHAAVIDAANSKNVGGVTLVGTSTYCLTGIPFSVRGGQATIDDKDSGFEVTQFGLGGVPACPAGTQAFVITFDGTTAAAAGFFVVLYG